MRRLRGHYIFLIVYGLRRKRFPRGRRRSGRGKAGRGLAQGSVWPASLSHTGVPASNAFNVCLPLVAKTLPCNAGDMGLTSGQGTKIPHAMSN